ncbi:DUF1189 domain-containing protein [Alkalibacterium indicireducens]|uniref:Maltodextrin utilization protein YvdJ n=1 Tax=Alkalibacterium indicireducens TaxID=398758 RepID=A0ABN1AS12_9LACT
MKEYILIGFLNPKKLVQAKNMTRKQVLAYFTFLTLILTLSLASLLSNVMGNLQNDGTEIAETLPTFTIEDGQLQTEADQETYVHQTNLFLFFFDPNGAIETNEIDANLERLNVPIGIGLMQDEFYMNVTGRSLPVSYEQLDGLDDTYLRTTFQQIGRLSPLVLVLIFLIAYFASAFVLLYEWLIVSLFANILVTLFRLRFKFRKNARMALVSLSVPTLLLSILEGIGLAVPFAFELKLGFALYFLFTSLKAVAPERKDPHNKG